jgi:tetratricopeptide (TPR) repeat protein
MIRKSFVNKIFVGAANWIIILVLASVSAAGYGQIQPQSLPQPSIHLPDEPKPAPTTPEAKQDYVKVYEELQAARTADELNEGIRRAQEFARKYPGTALSYAAIGEARFIQARGCENGVSDDVIMLARKAIAVDPQLAEGHILAAKAAFCSNDQSMYFHANQAIKLAPTNSTSMFVEARAMEQDGDFKGSEQMFRQAIAALNNPVRKANVYLWLGRMLTSDSRAWDDLLLDLDKSEDAFRKSMELDPSGSTRRCEMFSFIVRFRSDVSEAEKLLQIMKQNGPLCTYNRDYALLDYVLWAKRFLIGKESTAGLNALRSRTGMSADQAFVQSAQYVSRGDVIRALLRAKAISNIDTIGDGEIRNVRGCCQAIVNAAYRHNLELVQFLLKNGANVNAEGETKRTSLVYALIGQDFKMTEFLLANGARPNARFDAGLLPLDSAIRARKNGPELVAVMLKYHADPNGKSGNMPMMIRAVEVSNLDIVKQMLAHGADPNVKATSPIGVADVWTPLRSAIGEVIRPDILAALLDAGARPEWPIGDGDVLHTIDDFTKSELDPSIKEKLADMRKMIVAAEAGRSAK